MVEQLWQRQILCASAPSAAPHCGAAAAAASEAATSSARARGAIPVAFSSFPAGRRWHILKPRTT